MHPIMVVSQDSVSQQELPRNFERKRHRLSSPEADSNDGVQHPFKRRKHRVAATTSSKFWDNLSKQFLTKYALQELNDRNALEERPSFPAHHATEECTPVDRYLLECTPARLEDIQQFANSGNINLTDLRGV